MVSGHDLSFLKRTESEVRGGIQGAGVDAVRFRSESPEDGNFPRIQWEESPFVES